MIKFILKFITCVLVTLFACMMFIIWGKKGWNVVFDLQHPWDN